MGVAEGKEKALVQALTWLHNASKIHNIGSLIGPSPSLRCKELRVYASIEYEQ